MNFYVVQNLLDVNIMLETQETLNLIDGFGIYTQQSTGFFTSACTVLGLKLASDIPYPCLNRATAKKRT